MRYDDLVLSGQLWTYLADLNEQAKNRLQLIIKQMQEAESVTENFGMAILNRRSMIHLPVRSTRSYWSRSVGMKKNSRPL